MKVKTEVIRVDDQLMVRCFLNCSIRKRFDTCSVEMRTGTDKISIISTSEGRVENEVIYSPKTTITIMFEYAPNVECLVGYLRGDEIVEHESQHLIIEQVKSIQESETEIQEIKSINADFSVRQEKFAFALKKVKRTPWRLRMIIEDDIIIKVNMEGKKRVFIAFGEVVTGLLATDLIFSLYPGIKSFIIPKEIVWKRYGRYSKDARIACSQIVQADFHNVSDVHYKMNISNILPLTEFTKKVETRRLRDFSTPLGTMFDKRLWRMEELPVYRED